VLVPAVERATRLLDCLSQADTPMPLHALMRKLALPKSSVHGLLNTLCALGLAVRNDDATYSLGPHCLTWADAFTRQSRVLHAFQTATEALVPLREETVMLATLAPKSPGAPLEVQYLACHQGQRALAVAFRVGGRFPATCTSSGKAMLATYPADEAMALVGSGSLPALTAKSLKKPSELRAQLEAFRATGVAVDDEETALGMQCFGAPVFSAGQSHAIAAVAVSLIKASVTPARYRDVAHHIGALAAVLSKRLGATLS
jgi:DNA-binding IclR family transcriptional regulator